MDLSEPTRTPPHSPEAERALLGALLLEPDHVEELSEQLAAEDFFDGRHRTLYGTLLALAERSDPIELVTLAEALKAQDALGKVGGHEYLVELAGSVASGALAQHHAGLVRQTSVLRKLIREAGEVIAAAFDTRPDGDAVRELLDATESRMLAIAEQGDTSTVERIDKAITETFRRLDARSGKDSLTGLTTGYYELDEMLAGLNKGELVVVAARPSMGKTAFALNLIDNAAFSQPDWLSRSPSVLLFSLEMGSQSLVSRMLCSRARVPAHLLRSGRVPSDMRQQLLGAADELRHARIHIDDTPGLTMMALRSRARRLRNQQGLDLIVVDYLQLLTVQRAESRQQEISSISRSLKSLARELDVPVVALAQLSRQVESRDPPRPQLADLRESGSIEQDADVVMLLYRPEYYAKYRTDENRGIGEIIVAKQRNGPTGEVRLQFFPEFMRFENRAPDGIQQVVL